MITTRLKFVALVAAITLTACGGGGGDSAPSLPVAASADGLPLYSAYLGYLNAGHVYRYGLSGTCGGSASETISPPAAGTFPGGATMAKTTTMSIDRASCSAVAFAGTQILPPGSTTSTGMATYDAAGNPRQSYAAAMTFAPGSLEGTFTPGTADQFVAFTTVLGLPATVRVGDTGIAAGGTVYSDAAMTKEVGTQVLSYVIEADTETSAIVKIITRVTGANGYTEVDSYRLTTAGSVSLLNKDIQYANGVRFNLTP